MQATWQVSREIEDLDQLYVAKPAPKKMVVQEIRDLLNIDRIANGQLKVDHAT